MLPPLVCLGLDQTEVVSTVVAKSQGVAHVLALFLRPHSINGYPKWCWSVPTGQRTPNLKYPPPPPPEGKAVGRWWRHFPLGSPPLGSTIVPIVAIATESEGIHW